MRNGITFEVTASDRARLEATVADRNRPQKHVWRANIILLTGAGCGTAEIMQRTGKAKTCVWRRQERIMQAGVDGLLKDKTRPSRKPPLSQETVARVVELTRGPPPARRSDALDLARHGQSGGHLGELGAADLPLSRASAAPGPAVQTVERP